MKGKGRMQKGRMQKGNRHGLFVPTGNDQPLETCQASPWRSLSHCKAFGSHGVKEVRGILSQRILLS